MHVIIKRDCLRCFITLESGQDRLIQLTFFITDTAPPARSNGPFKMIVSKDFLGDIREQHDTLA